LSELVQLSILPLLIVGGLASFFFLAIGIFAFWSARNAEAKYLPVQAKILSKRRASDVVIDEDGPLPVSGPVIEYEYEVDGKMFRCDVVMSGGAEKRSNPHWAEKILRQHDVGQTVTAYYNPDDPSQAFLVKGDRGFVPYFLVGFGAIGLALAGVFANVAGHLTAYIITVAVIAIASVGWLAFQLRRGSKDARPQK
jgi:hypothetical protein